MNHRDRMLKKAKRTKSPRDWEAYKRSRNLTTKAISKAHNKYVMDIIGDLDASSETDQYCGIKRFWRYVKSTKKENIGIPPLHHKNGTAYTDKEKAEVLSKQYEKVCTKERTNDIPNLGPSPYSSMPDINFTKPGILKLLLKLQPQKTTGPDMLPPRILRELANEIAPSLTIIFQQIYDTGDIPEDWKVAMVCPINKIPKPQGTKELSRKLQTDLSHICFVQNIRSHCLQ